IALLKSAEKVYPQDQDLPQLEAKLNGQVADERRAVQMQAARDTVAKTIAATTHSVDDLKTAAQALAVLLGADKNNRDALALRKQFVESVANQLRQATAVGDFDALTKFADEQAAVLGAEPQFATLKKDAAELRAKLVETEQARVAAQAGELVLNAYPWGTVESVLDSNRKPVALPAAPSPPPLLPFPAA